MCACQLPKFMSNRVQLKVVLLSRLDGMGIVCRMMLGGVLADRWIANG